MDDFGRELLNAIENAAIVQPVGTAMRLRLSPDASHGTAEHTRRRAGGRSNVAFTNSRGRTQTALADINITPLVDVVLVLLLIFMLTAPVLQSGVEVAVPHTRSVEQLNDERTVITIDKDQNVFMDDKPVNIHQLPTLLLTRRAKGAKGHGLRPR